MGQQLTYVQVAELVSLANRMGAEGVFLVRGASSAALRVGWPEMPMADSPLLELGEPHRLVVVMRFPAGDGGVAGVESR